MPPIAAAVRSLPEDSVAFVRPEHEIEDIQGHLAAFLRDPESYRALGRNGRRHVAEHHSIEKYVSGLLEIAGRAPEFRAKWIARDLARRSATAMTGWSDTATIGPLSVRAAHEIELLTAGASTEISRTS